MRSNCPCRDDERTTILAIVNAAAEAYRDVIPADRLHEPYMSVRELDSEIAAGVTFWGCEADGALVGIMGIQPVRDVDLIRHAYVSPDSQRRGIGSELLEDLAGSTSRCTLVGTWAAADWARALCRFRRSSEQQPALTQRGGAGPSGPEADRGLGRASLAAQVSDPSESWRSRTTGFSATSLKLSNCSPVRAYSA